MLFLHFLVVSVTPRKIDFILQNLDESDLEEIVDEDEEELVTNQGSRHLPLFDGNWSDDTDSDPDYVPDFSTPVTPPLGKRLKTEKVGLCIKIPSFSFNLL